MHEHMAAVLESADDADVGPRIPGDERFEEFHEAFNAVPYSRRVLRVAITGVPVTASRTLPSRIPSM